MLWHYAVGSRSYRFITFNYSGGGPDAFQMLGSNRVDGLPSGVSYVIDSWQ